MRSIVAADPNLLKMQELPTPSPATGRRLPKRDSSIDLARIISGFPLPFPKIPSAVTGKAVRSPQAN